MTGLEMTRCAVPAVGSARWSSYRVLGYAGYVAASVLAAALATSWHLSLGEMLVALLAPPGAFLVVVAIAAMIAGRQIVVFYQAAFAAVAQVAFLGFAIGGDVARLIDVTVMGVGLLVVFGRVGCFHVACCHGRPTRWGVVYGRAHVAVGFWRRWAGRRLLPVPLLESAGALVLVGVGLAVSEEPGRAAVVFATGYAVLRFFLEFLRGDLVRPYLLGVSEGQWWSVATMIIVSSLWPAVWTLGPAAVIELGAIWLVARREQRELFLPPHLRLLDRACEAVLADPTHSRRDTALGVGVSCHELPDSRLDWVLSSQHPGWSDGVARRIARDLWADPEVKAGRTPGIVHVIVPGGATAGESAASSRARS